VKRITPTNGERLLIRRRRTSESQVDAAERYGVSLHRYRLWEADKDPAAPKQREARLEPFESCFLRRRRAGVSLRELAEELDLSRWWLCQMEQGKADSRRLIEYWTARERPWRRYGRTSSRKLQAAAAGT